MAKINFSNLKKPYFIAEIGGNHAGNKKTALEGILNAKRSGANCVKFQMYKSEELVKKSMPVMQHVKKVSKEKFQYQRFKKLEINEKDVISYYKSCVRNKIDLAVTPFYTDSVKFLSKYVTFFKIASGDINFYSMIKAISKLKKPVVVSTGMSSYSEIKEILKILRGNQVVLLHCISSYPTKEEDLNMRSLLMLKKFKKTIGFSDHTKGNIGAIMSIPYGAKVFEKHFLPNFRIKNVGDYKLSLNPDEMKKYIYDVTKSFMALGKVRKTFFPSERPFLNSLRRSPYFRENFSKGHIISEKNIIFLRPQTTAAIENNKVKFFIGKKLKRSVGSYQVLKKDLF